MRTCSFINSNNQYARLHRTFSIMNGPKQNSPSTTYSYTVLSSMQHSRTCMYGIQLTYVPLCILQRQWIQVVERGISVQRKGLLGLQNLLRSTKFMAGVCLFVCYESFLVSHATIPRSQHHDLLQNWAILMRLCPIIACYGFVDIAREVLTSRHSLKICVKLDTLIHMGYDRECPKNLSYIMKHYHWFHTINLDIQSVTYSNLCRRPVRHPPVK